MVQCYYLRYGTINEVDDAMCQGDTSPGGFSSCCVVGNTCLVGSLCYSPPLGSGSGFYTGACTDPEFSDSACIQQCGK